MSVARIMNNKVHAVITAAPGESVRTAAERLARHHVGALVVVDAQGTIVGMVLDGDVVRAAADRDTDIDAATVREIMSSCTLTCGPESSEAEVMDLMSTGRVQYLPVISKGRLSGIVSLGDVVRLRMEKIRELMTDIEQQVEAERFTTILQRRREADAPRALALAS